jgi:hypothetical protein
MYGGLPDRISGDFRGMARQSRGPHDTGNEDPAAAEGCGAEGEVRYQASASCSGLIVWGGADVPATASQSAVAETRANSPGSIL